MALITPPAERPYSAAKFDVLTWNSRMAAWLIEYALRVRPLSSEKKPWLLSPPSTVLLLSKPEIPRKLMRPKLPSGTAPGVRIAKLDQRRPLTGSSLIEV